MNKTNWQQTFFTNFIEEMKKEGFTPGKMKRFVWKPVPATELNMSGPDRDRNFKKIDIKTEDISKQLRQSFVNVPSGGEDFFQSRKLVLVIYPGFIHHLQKFPVFIDKKDLARTPADIVRLSVGKDGGLKEEHLKKGSGIKVAYVKYPRSNAAAETIIDKAHELMTASANLKKWVKEEGRKIIFIGYSYGAPLILETLARINNGDLKDDFILKNTLAFIAVNGAIGGSYLADSLLKSDALFNVEKFRNVMNIFKPAGWPLMIKTREEREDLPAGIKSLGHGGRQERLDWYMDKVPANIKYFSIASVIPLTEYTRKPWNNVDGFTLFVMALISNQHSIYNDGQVALQDAMIPDFPHVKAENIINLGSVKSHHWGVGYRTMNLGRNKYPRLPFYRALARTLEEAGVCH